VRRTGRVPRPSAAPCADPTENCSFSRIAGWNSASVPRAESNCDTALGGRATPSTPHDHSPLCPHGLDSDRLWWLSHCSSCTFYPRDQAAGADGEVSAGAARGGARAGTQVQIRAARSWRTKDSLRSGGGRNSQVGALTTSTVGERDPRFCLDQGPATAWSIPSRPRLLFDQ